MDSSEIAKAGTTSAGALLALDLLRKLLGPSAETAGKQLGIWTEQGLKNIERIALAAIRKKGDVLPPGEHIPAKLARALIYDGPFCDDPIAAEYFGGVLASSRSGVSRDDRGVTFLAQLEKMSSYQIRAHYVFYHTFKRLTQGYYPNPPTHHAFNQWIGFPKDSFLRAMGFDDNEKSNATLLMEQVLRGLEKDALGASSWAVKDGLGSMLAVPAGESRSSWIIFRALGPGAELFLWAYGLGNLPLFNFFNPELTFPPIEGIELPGDAWIIKGAVTTM